MTPSPSPSPSSSPYSGSPGSVDATSLTPSCTANGGNVTVYGSGFSALGSVSCLIISESNYTTTTPGVVVADSEVLCAVATKFTECDGGEGSRMYSMCSIQIVGASSQVSKPLTVGVLNNLCPWNSTVYVYHNGDGLIYYMPLRSQVLELCEATGASLPFACPKVFTQPQETTAVNATVPTDPPCDSLADNTVCLWAPVTSDVGIGICPMTQCCNYVKTHCDLDCHSTNVCHGVTSHNYFGDCYTMKERGDGCGESFGYGFCEYPNDAALP